MVVTWRALQAIEDWHGMLVCLCCTEGAHGKNNNIDISVFLEMLGNILLTNAVCLILYFKYKPGALYSVKSAGRPQICLGLSSNVNQPSVQQSSESSKSQVSLTSFSRNYGVCTVPPAQGASLSSVIQMTLVTKVFMILQ